MTQEALKLALEALEGMAQDLGKFPAEIPAITAIKEALAQPEQEPVAWGFQNTAITGSNRWMMLREEIPANDQYGGALWTPLYTTPPQRTWVGLREEEIGEMMMQTWGCASIAPRHAPAFAQAIEAKLKEKNGYAEEKNT